MSKHKRSVKSETIRAYTGGAGTARTGQNPAAAGGICLHQTCACGATRKVNQNGRHAERGEWTVTPS